MFTWKKTDNNSLAERDGWIFFCVEGYDDTMLSSVKELNGVFLRMVMVWYARFDKEMLMVDQSLGVEHGHCGAQLDGFGRY